MKTTNMLELVDDQVITYYRALTRLLGGQFVEDERIVWFATGRCSLARFNGVLRTVVGRPSDLGRAVDPVLAVFRKQAVPFFWAGWPPGSAPGLGDYLRASGIPIESYTMPAMARRLDDLPQAALPDDVSIAPVQREDDQAGWLDVLMDGFAAPPEARADFAQFVARSVAEPRPAFDHFLARWRGEPYAIASLLRAERSAGVYHVATRPALRGRGLGAALTLAAMRSAQAAGYAQAILFATPSGYPLYRRLGFETVAEADLFVCAHL